MLPSLCMYEAQEHSVAVEVIKNLTFQLSNSRPVSCQTLSLLSQFLSTMSETGKCQQKRKKRKKELIPPSRRRHGNPSSCGCSGSAVPPAARAQSHNCDKAFRLEDTYLDLGRKRQEVRLNWLTREWSPPFRQSPTPPFNELEVPPVARFGSEKAGHVSQMGRGGEWGDPPTSLEFCMTKYRKAGEHSVLAVFTRLPVSRSLIWSLGQQRKTTKDVRVW